MRLPITGSWGDRIGSLLWHVLGRGLGAPCPSWASVGHWAAFERLGSLSAGRAAALGAGLILLIPYGIGTVTDASSRRHTPPGARRRSWWVSCLPCSPMACIERSARRAGSWSACLPSRRWDSHRRWHPPRRVKNPGDGSRETGGERGRTGGADPREAATHSGCARGRARTDGRRPEGGQSSSQAHAARCSHPASRPAGVLIPPIDLLHPRPGRW